MRYTVDMTSGGMIYIPSFMKLVEAFKQYWGFASAIWNAVMLVLLILGIYELRRLDGVRCHDIHTKFNKDWFKYSNVNWGDTHTDSKTHWHKIRTDTHTHEGDFISLLLFFQIPCPCWESDPGRTVRSQSPYRLSYPGSSIK
jgi:hypothetical protein